MQPKMKTEFYSRYYGANEIPHGVPFAVRSLGFNHCAPGYRFSEMQKRHPKDHQFGREQWRTLDTLTIAHITRGSGVFISEESGEVAVTPNTLFIVFPGVRHKYRFKTGTGWDSEWVEIMSESALHILSGVGVSSASPVRHFKALPSLTARFSELISLSRESKPAQGVLLAAAANRVLAEVVSQWNSGVVEDGHRNEARMVEDFKSYLDGEPSSEVLSVSAASRATGLSASRLRTIFKNQMGVSPKKYQLNRRIERAKDLLAKSEMSVTAIAESCGFATLYAFSRQFSRHVGTSPLKYRSEKLAQL